MRWSVFVLGPASAGKTALWRTLAAAQEAIGEPTRVIVINPKSVSRDELYGCVHPSSREWRDGLVSRAFRDMAADATHAHQWIVLDGDIDPEWIESMNTVMDDNKVLTLASNERIPLTKNMRLLLEIDSMAHCSPATVSRGVVIYVNAEDVGWRPVVDSWIARAPAGLRPTLTALVARYVDPALDYVRRQASLVVPQPPAAMVTTLTRLLDAALAPWMEAKDGGDGAAVAPPPPPPNRKLVEAHFVHAAVWAFGGGLVPGGGPAFSAWWVAEFKGGAALPDGASVFDVFVDAATGGFAHWGSVLPAPAAVAAAGSDGSTPFIPTVETARVLAVLHTLLAAGHPVLLAGPPGAGKTTLLKQALASWPAGSDAPDLIHLPLAAPASAGATRGVLEAPLERAGGTRYAPAGGRKVLYFVDDANAPAPDKYGTASAGELLRQLVDSGGWWDAAKGARRDVVGVSIATALNPAAGTATLAPRLQRHFSVLTVAPPSADAARSVFGALLAARAGLPAPRA